MRHSNRLETVELPSLETVGSTFEIRQNPAITSIVVPNLSSVNSFHAVRNYALLSISAPLLEEVSEEFKLEDNTPLSSVDVSSLECVGSYTISGNDFSDDDYYDLLGHLTGC